MIVSGSEKYFRSPFKDEAEIERVVKDYAQYLFGSSILLVPKAKITTMGGAGTIPDGFVVDVESEEWFMVEAELASHGTWLHIAPQISKAGRTRNPRSQESGVRIQKKIMIETKTSVS